MTYFYSPSLKLYHIEKCALVLYLNFYYQTHDSLLIKKSYTPYIKKVYTPSARTRNRSYKFIKKQWKL